MMKISIGIQEGNSFWNATNFKDALKWINKLWEEKNFLPSFADSIASDTGSCYVVTGRAFNINQEDELVIYAMKEQEFLRQFFNGYSNYAESNLKRNGNS